MAITLDTVLFRQLFAEFADEGTYPDAVIQARWDAGTSYVSDEDCGSLTGTKRAFALQCMTAHLMRLAKGQATGDASGVVLQATVDKVSVMLQAPPSRGEWGHWLAQTPYGQQLAALLAAASAGGFSVGGLPERAGFRKVGGVF